MHSLRTILLVAIFAVWLEPLGAQSDLAETSVRVVSSVHSTDELGTIRDFGYIEISGDIRQNDVASFAAAFPQARRTAGSFTHSGEPVVRVFVSEYVE